ncbi:MAG: hypothetical protein K5754_00035 [Butyrivibrio sp.]|jgi:plastocyanin|nr:hypothetical protein [Butyrivibrio sp.]
MRFYGVRSGCNKPAAHTARMIMWAKREVERENRAASKRKKSPYDAEKLNYKFNSQKELDLEVLEESDLTKAIEEACSENSINRARYAREKSEQYRRNIFNVIICLIVLLVGFFLQSNVVVVATIIAIVVEILCKICIYKPVVLEEAKYIYLEFDENECYSQTLALFLESLNGAFWVRELQRTITGINDKIHSGATSLSDLCAVKIFKSKEPLLELHFNESVYCIGGRDQTLVFLPNTILVKTGDKIRFVKNENIKIYQSKVRFISEENIIGAKVIDKTWRYVNKNGSPDRRYKNNYQIDIYQLYLINLVGDGINISLYVNDEDVYNNSKKVKIERTQDMNNSNSSTKNKKKKKSKKK